MIRSLLLLLVLFAGVNSQAPTCSDGEDSSSACEERTCQLYQWRDDLLSGVNLQRGQSFPEGMSSDVVIPVQFHATHWYQWSRFLYWLEIEPNSTEKLLFAPGLTMPTWKCHKKFNNIQTSRTAKEQVSEEALQDYFNRQANKQAPKIEDHRVLEKLVNSLDRDYYTASHAINTGDPLYVACENDDRSEDYVDPTQFPWFQRFPTRDMECIDTLYAGVSQTVHNQVGALAKFAFEEGQTIQSSELIHIHRSELFDPKNDQHELLLNYCFGLEKSNVLLLPTGHLVNYINHASAGKQQPNVGIRWKGTRLEIVRHFKEIDHLFQEDESAQLEIEYYALRDIQPDEELLLDYGDAWQEAFDQHIHQGNHPESFRHEIRLPLAMFPQSWLEKQEAIQTSPPPIPSWSTRPLEAGEVEQLTVKESGETPAKYLYRIGLGPDLSRKMLEYANKQGITELLKHHVNHKPLEKNATVHYRINGGLWWLKRFDNWWHSNMHYITPDDPVANADFLSALSEAGFDKVLEGLGKHFGMDGLQCYYPSFIAVSHCTKTGMHDDAEKSGGKNWNMIFPVMQVEDDDTGEIKPELMLGYDEPNKTVLPYRYEPEAAVSLGDLGLHGTAPCDYRGNVEKMRMVVSVYMADPNEENFEWVMWDNDPPYPPIQYRREFLWQNRGRDWNPNNPDHKLPTRDYFESVVERKGGNLYNEETGFYY